MLFLDNADDIEAFRNSKDEFIPRRGRILITSRDSRYQGEIAPAANGLNILPMNKKGLELLTKSIPETLSINDNAHTTETLVHELAGYHESIFSFLSAI
jgi:hypothetical protein